MLEAKTKSWAPEWQRTLRDGRYRGIGKAVLTGAAARVLSSALTLVTLPLAVRYLGAERYGVWATVASLAVWINLLDLGIANSLTNAISQAFARQERSTAARALSNALAVTSVVVIVAAGGFVAAWSRIRWTAVFNVGGNLSAEVKWTVLVAAILMLLALPANLAGKVFAGY